MEDALVPITFPVWNIEMMTVLILVLMEDALVQRPKIQVARNN